MDRLRAWLVAAPLVAAGVLTAHAAAYRLTGTPGGPLHGYLEHAPQALLVTVIVGVALGGLGARLQAPPAWAFATVAPAAFVVQEHLERLLHEGALPWLATSPAFWLGLVLQVPVALVVWLVARRLLDALVPARERRSGSARALLEIAAPVAPDVARVDGGLLAARGPPALLRP